MKQYHYDWSDYKEYFDANNDVNDVEATSLTTPSDEMLYRDARPPERERERDGRWRGTQTRPEMDTGDTKEALTVRE